MPGLPPPGPFEPPCLLNYNGYKIKGGARHIAWCARLGRLWKVSSTWNCFHPVARSFFLFLQVSGHQCHPLDITIQVWLSTYDSAPAACAALSTALPSASSHAASSNLAHTHPHETTLKASRLGEPRSPPEFSQSARR